MARVEQVANPSISLGGDTSSMQRSELPVRQERSSASQIGNLGRIWKRAFGVVSREHVLSLADQAVVSGTSFLTTLLIARWGGPSQLGVYATGISLLISLLAFQDSLICQPYLIQKHCPGGNPAEHAGAYLTFSALFSVGSIVALTVAGLGLLKWGSDAEIIAITWVLAGVAPFALTRDFARRFAFAHLDMGRAFLLDLATAIIQLLALGWLAVNGWMSALTACAALGAACAFTTIMWLHHARAKFRIRAWQVRITLRQAWALGKWLFAGRVTSELQRLSAYWILMVIAGAAITGAYAACMSIVNFANPLLIGLTNVLMPKSALAWKEGGWPKLRYETIRSTVLIAALMAPLILAVLVAGDTTLRFLFRGNEFEGLGHTLTVLVAATLMGALTMPPSNALAAMERVRAIFITDILAATLTVVCVSLFVIQWGLLGAAYGWLAGTVADAVGRWVAFFMHAPRVCDPVPVSRAAHNTITPRALAAVAHISWRGALAEEVSPK
jgi:O-antigen/teichoic acid export membrane protein